MGVGVTMPTHVGVGQNTGLARSRSRNPSRNQSQNQSRSSSRNRSRVRSHSPSLNQSGIQSRSRSKPSGHSRTPQSKLQPRRTQRGRPLPRRCLCTQAKTLKTSDISFALERTACCANQPLFGTPKRNEQFADYFRTRKYVTRVQRCFKVLTYFFLRLVPLQ